MIKTFISYGFLLIYLSVSFNFFLPVAAFKLNEKFIAENLCENKNKPEKMCDGKCYLGKQMEKHTGSSSKPRNKIVITNTNEMPHLMAAAFKLFNSFPRLKNYSVYCLSPIDLYADINIPPPKHVPNQI
jgi:hypothetical protein